MKKHAIKDFIVLLILNFIIMSLYEEITHSHIKIFDLAWWSSVCIAIGLSYAVDSILIKYFNRKY